MCWVSQLRNHCLVQGYKDIHVFYSRNVTVFPLKFMSSVNFELIFPMMCVRGYFFHWIYCCPSTTCGKHDPPLIKLSWHPGQLSIACGRMSLLLCSQLIPSVYTDPALYQGCTAFISLACSNFEIGEFQCYHSVLFPDVHGYPSCLAFAYEFQDQLSGTFSFLMLLKSHTHPGNKPGSSGTGRLIRRSLKSVTFPNHPSLRDAGSSRDRIHFTWNIPLPLLRLPMETYPVRPVRFLGTSPEYSLSSS